MTDWLRPLAPLGYLVGAILVIDQVLFVISQGPYNFSSHADRIRLAMLVASRLSAVGIGLILLGGSAILSRHGRVIKWWLPLVALVVLAAAVTVILAIVASPDLALPVADQRSPDYIVAARASRIRVIITGLAGTIALMAIAGAVRGAVTSPAESTKEA